MHPALKAISDEFTKVEANLTRKAGTQGGVNDWPSYQFLLGRINEVQEGRTRAMEVVSKALGLKGEEGDE